MRLFAIRYLCFGAGPLYVDELVAGIYQAFIYMRVEHLTSGLTPKRATRIVRAEERPSR